MNETKECRHKDMCELSVKRGTQPYINNCCDSCPAKGINYRPIPQKEIGKDPIFMTKIVNKLGNQELVQKPNLQSNFTNKVVKK